MIGKELFFLNSFYSGKRRNIVTREISWRRRLL